MLTLFVFHQRKIGLRQHSLRSLFTHRHNDRYSAKYGFADNHMVVKSTWNEAMEVALGVLPIKLRRKQPTTQDECSKRGGPASAPSFKREPKQMGRGICSSACRHRHLGVQQNSLGCGKKKKKQNLTKTVIPPWELLYPRTHEAHQQSV